MDTQKVLEERLDQAAQEVTRMTNETKTMTTWSVVPNTGLQVPLKHVVSEGSQESEPKLSSEDVDDVRGRSRRPEG